jgi:hypothetical protein
MINAVDDFYDYYYETMLDASNPNAQHALNYD